MKSRITIEVDFDRENQPVIQLLFKKSDDIRDNLIQSFLEKLGGESNWCRIDKRQYIDDPLEPERNFQRWYIVPVVPSALNWQASHMKERGDDWQRSHPQQIPLGDTPKSD